MTDDSVFILAVLALNVFVSEWLARHTALRHLGSSLLVIVLTAVVANLGVIPTYRDDIPVYSGVFSILAPLGIFLLLLRVDLRSILRAGLPMVGFFLLGALGTVLGVLAGMWIAGGQVAFGEEHFALAGMFTGTYIGGSINFNAVALEYGVVENGALYAGSAAVDSAMTTVWMAVTVALPRLLVRFSKRSRVAAVRSIPGSSLATPGEKDLHDDRETVSPLELALLLALGAATLWGSEALAAWIAQSLGVAVPSILILTTIALVLAQIPLIQSLRGAQVGGWLSVMIFLAVIGALCDLESLRALGPLGLRLSLFVTVLVLVHGLVIFGGGILLRADPALVSVASQANIGGGTSALALARSLGRADLVVPAILVGSLGNALGTYLGFLVAVWSR